LSNTASTAPVEVSWFTKPHLAWSFSVIFGPPFRLAVLISLDQECTFY
jgi:hypothetical protein